MLLNQLLCRQRIIHQAFIAPTCCFPATGWLHDRGCTWPSPPLQGD
jgi:hypothetical protein